MRTKGRFGLLGAAALVAALVVGAAPAGATTTDHARPVASADGWRDGRRSTTDLSLVHGVPNLRVDIYVVKDRWAVKKLSGVTFGTAADLGTAFPGFVTPGTYSVDVVAAGASRWHPLLSARLFLGRGQSKSVVAYVTASSAGVAGAPRLGVFDNDVSPTHGAARVTVRHLAIAPTVGVYADGSVPITTGFSNGQTATVEVPATTYGVTVTAPSSPATVLFNVGNVALPARTNTLAFAIGSYPSTFRVVALQVPTAR